MQQAAQAANAWHAVFVALALLNIVKIEKSKAYNSNVEDASILNSFMETSAIFSMDGH